MARRAELTAVAVGCLALLPAGLALGSGPLNGDAAAYLVSAPTDRWTHAAYVLVGQRVGLDALSLLAAVVAVAAGSRADPRRALAAAAVVLPWAAFGEVDLPWVAAMLAAAAWRPALAAVAVAISPTALLALPWLWARDRRAEGPIAAALAVAALTALSGGAWWTGERGVLGAGPWMVGLTAGRVALHLPWALILTDLRSVRSLPALLPLVLAPSDTPAWLLPGLVVASRTRAPRWAVGLQLAGAVLALGARAAAVRGETEVVERVAAELRPGDGIVAPWTWGARVAVARTGDPYGWPWHPPGRFLRDQRAQWCEAPPTRILGLPPDANGFPVPVAAEPATCD